MLRTIEVEEIVKIYHKIYVEYDNEEQLKNALNSTICMFTLDDFVENLINCGIKVKNGLEDYTEETDSIDYFDDYVED